MLLHMIEQIKRSESIAAKLEFGPEQRFESSGKARDYIETFLKRLHNSNTINSVYNWTKY